MIAKAKKEVYQNNYIGLLSEVKEVENLKIEINIEFL